MSEFQYYEFQAIDKPLTAEQIAYIRTLSRRVNPTSTHAVFTYSYSDLPKNALEVLEQHFDALLYMANWGSRELAFRFPRKAIDLEAINPYYFASDEISIKESPQYIVLSIAIHEDEGSDYIETDGLLASLLPLRDDILRGDFRALYLGWLKAATTDLDDDEYNPYDYPAAESDDDDGLEDDDEAPQDAANHDGTAEQADADLLEPPVPPGLQQPTAALQAFIEFLEVDPDLLQVAAAASPPLKEVKEPLAAWVMLLPEAERNAFLVRIAQGDTQAGRELLRRLRQVGGDTNLPAPPTTPRRTLDSLIGAVDQIKREREERERQKAEEARRQRLEALAKRETATWRQVATLIEQKTTKAYDEAITLLLQLRELAEYQGKVDEFKAQIAGIETQYKNRPALLQRLRSAKLG
ncbi:MAG: hypothetical protein EXR62_17495 [Chloroflexi bacterium]|nr:hypothetical protein [Chloroflexota bacterium]